MYILPFRWDQVHDTIMPNYGHGIVHYGWLHIIDGKDFHNFSSLTTIQALLLCQ